MPPDRTMPGGRPVDTETELPTDEERQANAAAYHAETGHPIPEWLED